MPYARYKYESNSQLVESVSVESLGCKCHMLDTSLKAIHNKPSDTYWATADVYAIC